MSKIALKMNTFILGCIRPIGLASSRIKDSQLTASSSQGGALPNLGRLNRSPLSGEKYSYWQPSIRDANPYIQLTLRENTIITGIATQGHFNFKIKEFATSYTVAYLQNNRWIFGKVYTEN